MARYTYRDAYVVRTYECPSCRKREAIWNSRDGRAPLAVPCSNRNGCTAVMSTILPEEDRCLRSYKLQLGQRYFTKLSATRAHQLALEGASKRAAEEGLVDEQKKELARKYFKYIFGDGNEPDLAVHL